VSQTAKELAAYNKGYAACRRKGQQPHTLTATQMRQQFEREVFLMALPAVMAGNWTDSNGRINTAKGYVSLAKDFATEAGKKFIFTPDAVGGGQ
jgi:hypothetical protein